MTATDRPASAGLTALIILQLTMLFALYTLTEPHPPVATPLFGIGPFLGASFAAAAAAIWMGPTRAVSGRGLSLLSAAMALVSYGPQKYVDAAFPLIWPSVIAGQVACLVIVLAVIRATAAKPVEA